MKKLILLSLSTLVSCLTFAQIPNQPIPQRPLYNQFRDYVEFRQNQQRPKIEKKDGKVIITMTEEQFSKMRMMRQRQHMVRARFLPAIR